MNDEMVMKWRGGTKSRIVRRMLNVFNLHFPTPAMKAMSRICACKTERNLQIFDIWLVLAIQTVMPVGYTILLLSAKTRQGNQRNEASRLRKCIKKSSALSFAWNGKKSHCKLNSLHCRQENRNEKGIGEKELRPQANNV